MSLQTQDNSSKEDDLSQSSLSTSENQNTAQQAEKAEDSTPHDDGPPDGGLCAWLVVAGAWCCLACSFGWITCIGVFQDYYVTHQLSNYSSSTVAWIPATETFLMFAGAPICGRIFDSYGARWLVIVGSFFQVFGVMMISLCKEYYQFFLAQSICSAIGSSCLFWGSNTAVGTWFHKRRAYALGIVSSGSSIGGLVGTAMIPNLFNSIGFGWTMRIVGFMMLGLLIVAIATVKSRLHHVPKRFSRPSIANLMASDLVQPLREPPVVLLSCAGFFFFMGVFLPYNFLISESVYYGMSQELANYTLTILSATSIFGRILPGWIGDRFGRFNIMIITSLLSTILVLALWIPANSNAPNLVFAALYGFSSGAFVALVPALIAQVCTDMKKLGCYMGAAYIVISPAILIAQPVGGVLITADGGDFTWLQFYCGVSMFVGVCFFVLSRGAHGGFGWSRI
ncbi:hypothetical protein M409DRAFT_16196 [Zasmidium cellare ATCC 36951]|uniref:Major facilitator superfamily (MFS) profile domain-containing protein n=1 Tax=Zasmidium cellare ATCC 36951 TaxID=1080233 RepID=A0A6A6D675_ZASCE|nr:uncharacterized protein M409DRAFT_16196 [Zasmidium cellare ATCC 36951]KAF2173928.1 hypothetical protein M409DRAFT_16196 [Zasmidium cellare ATCC 36951]